jgi:hypothetical protein
MGYISKDSWMNNMYINQQGSVVSQVEVKN